MGVGDVTLVSCVELRWRKTRLEAIGILIGCLDPLYVVDYVKAILRIGRADLYKLYRRSYCKMYGLL